MSNVAVVYRRALRRLEAEWHRRRRMFRGDRQLYAGKEHQYAMASAPSVKFIKSKSIGFHRQCFGARQGDRIRTQIAAARMSAFGGKADISAEPLRCPLLTQSDIRHLILV